MGVLRLRVRSADRGPLRCVWGANNDRGIMMADDSERAATNQGGSINAADMVQAEPVTDWVNDWDWLDDAWGANAIDIWNGGARAVSRRDDRTLRPRLHAGDNGGGLSDCQ